ncbi:hypothetical protein CTAM01_16905 [Colletotrichum tamarilloi]|uniref:Protein kinase domain-containing protein n=1 Tax=Colletotrichum tamarilloi TaxID=1209934 RepID=A0ABQ9QH68_9PEZI|nr:uncharacterized protein CTAM01_16905 [Colletotrichum tamarilloi]KAK1470226.1 hypothetical protein CTAM01_16905 [Colletotrichum tamarilloi]
MLQLVQHPNIVTVHEMYSDKANHHVAYGRMPRSLQEAVGNLFLNRYVKEGANFGPDGPKHWGLEVVSFLSATTAATSADELSEVGLRRCLVTSATDVSLASFPAFVAKRKVEMTAFSGHGMDSARI